MHPAPPVVRPHRRIRMVVALGLVAALAACSGSAGGTSSGDAATTSSAPSTTADATVATVAPTTAAPAPVAAMGALPLGVQSFVLIDETRDTPVNNDAPATKGRSLPTVVYYPTSGDAGPDAADPKAATEDAPVRDGRYPLLVFSHGVTGRGVFYAGELAAMASAGYIVIAPDYPLSNADSPGGPTIADVGNQPDDASYLIDLFTDGATGAREEELSAHIDADDVGAVGHSLGAVTSLGIGYSTCCADDRVDAVASWAGIFIPLQQEASPSPDRTEIPLLLVHGDQDETVPYQSSVNAFTAVDGPRWLITLPGAGHTPPFVGPSGGDQALLTTTATIDFFDAELKGDPQGIDRLDQAVADAGPAVATLQTVGR